MKRDCIHGQLARSCEICEKDAEIARMRPVFNAAARWKCAKDALNAARLNGNLQYEQSKAMVKAANDLYDACAQAARNRVISAGPQTHDVAILRDANGTRAACSCGWECNVDNARAHLIQKNVAGHIGGSRAARKGKGK